MRNIIISIVLTVFVCLGNNIKAQQAVVSGGNFHQNSQGSISWGLGEAVIETFEVDDIIITQGFQQSKLTITTIEELPESEFSITAFPNPANDFVYLKSNLNESDDVYFTMFDLNGKIVMQDKINSTLEKVSFRALKSGVYFIKISLNNKEMKTIKVIKQ
jgi:hypothetical protein